MGAAGFDSSLSASSIASSSTLSAAQVYACGTVLGPIPSATRIGEAGLQDAFLLRWDGNGSTPSWILQMGASGGTVSCQAMTRNSSGIRIVGNTDREFGDPTVHRSLGTGGIYLLQASESGSIQ